MALKDELKEYYTVQELAALVKVTEATIEKLEQGGELAGEVIGAVLCFPKREVENLLTMRRRAKLRRAAITVFGVMAAVAGAGVAWQKRRKPGQ